MSIQSEITRIQEDRNTIRTKLVELRLSTKPENGKPAEAITTVSNLDDCASAIDGIVNQGGVQAQVREGETYTIPAGYHNGTGTVAGIAGGGNYNLQSKQVTPTKAAQTVTPDDGYYGLSDVTVGAIPAAYQDVSGVTAAAGDVLANKIIVDATGKQLAGTMPNNGKLDRTIDGLTSTSVIIPAGYTTGGTVSLTDDIEQALAAI